MAEREVLTFLMQLCKLTVPKGGTVSIMSKTNTEGNSNEYYFVIQRLR
jgi:hypothetical protein